jgi:hypothetical protein
MLMPGNGKNGNKNLKRHLPMFIAKNLYLRCASQPGSSDYLCIKTYEYKARRCRLAVLQRIDFRLRDGRLSNR